MYVNGIYWVRINPDAGKAQVGEVEWLRGALGVGRKTAGVPQGGMPAVLVGDTNCGKSD
jgi:hypothetical protein